MLSWLAQPECHHLQWIRGVSVSMKQVSCSPEPNRLVTVLIVCMTFEESQQCPAFWRHDPTSRGLTEPDVPTDFTCFLQYLFLSKAQMALFDTVWVPMWNISLCWLAEGKKNKCPVPCTDSSKSKGSHVLVVFYCLCVLKSFSVCILWNAFLHHASSMLLSLPPSCFQL